ncbi:MAG: hypothetical protein QW035_01875 [Candidatus Anstonellales archaeon]
MRKLLVLLLLLAPLHAAFDLRSADIEVIISPSGEVHVTEKYDILVPSGFETTTYNSLLSKPHDLATWSTSTNISELRLHVDRGVVSVDNLAIKPQPLSQCNPLSYICHGIIIVDYDVSPYPGTNTTIVAIMEYKPRTKRYTFNPSILSFLRSDAGDMLIDSKTTLTFTLPKDSVIVSLNPLIGYSPSDFPLKGVSQVSFRNTILVQFSLVFEREESIIVEVSDFFSYLYLSLFSIFTKPEGVIMGAVIILIVGVFIYAEKLRKGWKVG